jgi:hypothetical protein
VIRAALGLLAALLLWTSPAGAAAPPRADVTVLRQGQSWTADFRFSGAPRVWLFVRSAITREGQQPWRPQSWRVETPGVRLERQGRYDILVAADGAPLPARVRIAFTPFREDLIADYDPALTFSDGSVALYTKQFVGVPVASAAAAAAMPLDLNGVRLPDSQTWLSFHDDAGPVLLAGRRVATLRMRDDGGDGTYVLFGRLRPIVTDAMSAIIDPGLPAWARDSLGRHVPEILGRYAAILGPAPGPKPTFIVSWNGPTSGRISIGGSVLPGLVSLAYEGSQLEQESLQGRSYGLRLIAHEGAHFWLGNAVAYQYSREAWITEGGADLLAFRTVEAVDPEIIARGDLNQSIADCVARTRGQGVESAEQRNDQRAYYACGAVFALVAEAASHRPFIEFVRTLIAANRADGILTRAEWLAELDRVSGDRTLSRDIVVLLDRGVDDPKAAIASLFTRAGVRFAPGADGMPRLQ